MKEFYRQRRRDERPILVTGGAGFIGANVADRLLSAGREVILLDNLSRAGVDMNALWLQRRHGRRLRFIVGDVRERGDVRRALAGVCHVFHFAAQVAVTTSIEDPRTDFDINAAGTLNLLEEMRAMPEPASILYTSTNKVYGALENIALLRRGRRYEPLDSQIATAGISESQPLDFHTPYGCSKGAAEQYVLDYARSFGIPSVVFRMSCVYGPHQFGTADQGWVTHFFSRIIEDQQITLYGDGMQVRDLLFVDDLVDAALRAWNNIGTLRGQAFNIGGGVDRGVSLLELIDLIGEVSGRRPRVDVDVSRAGDQRYYTSDTAKFRSAAAWAPVVSVRDGLNRLYDWLLEARRLAPEAIIAS